MLTRLLAMSALVFAIAGFVATRVAVADTVHGKIESAGAGMISITDTAGTASTFQVASGAKITMDGKKVKLEDLMPGAAAEVATETKNDQTVAVMITVESPL